MASLALLSGVAAVTVASALISPGQARQQAPDRIAGAAHAPDQAPDLGQRCRQLLEALPSSSRTDATTSEPAGADCLLRHVRFGIAQAGYVVDSLRLHGLASDFGGLPEQVPDKPLAIRVEARGIRFSPHTDNRKLAWMIAQQQVPFDATLDARYDPVTRRATLNELSLDGETLGHVLLRLTAGNVAAGRSADLFAAAGLTSLQMDLDSRRFLAGFALSPLLPLLPDDDPGAAVEAAKQEAVTSLRALLPQAGASAATTDALAGFVADFPHPQHPFTLSVSAANPVTANAIEAAGGSPSQLTALLRQLSVTASYTGAFR